MKIVSLNIWDLPLWFVRDRKERISRIKDFFHETDPDIVCLQESFDPDHRMRLNGFLGSAAYATSDTDVRSRNVLGTKLDTTGGLVTYSKFRVLESVFIPFRRLFFSPLEMLGRKGMLITLLDTPYGRLRVVNLHLYKKSLLWDEAIRVSQLKRVFAHMRSLGSLPTIMAGDFNQRDLAHNRKFLQLIAENNFVNPQGDMREPSYRAENKYVDIWINRIRRSKRLDYILHNDLGALHLRSHECRVLCRKEPMSDHDPVMLRLRPE